jgi:fatty-acid peroxygenase
MTAVIEQVRTKRLRPAEHAAVAVIANHHDLDGRLLSPRLAAVEMLNVLRPTVAVAWLVALSALALHHHPIWHERLSHGVPGDAKLFALEVRRFYPFFPFVAARVRDDFEWNGFRFERGALVLLDLYGTNHDTRLWDDPDQFRPERFHHRSGGSYDYIPQGGGDHFVHHRCAGEWITIELMRVAIDALTRAIVYDVPPQNLEVSHTRFPAQPASGMRIRNVTRVGPNGSAP